MIVYLFPRWTGNILIWSAHTNRLTIHIQAVVSNPLLPAQCRVDGLAAQRCPIVFPFNWNLDGAGHTEGLPVFLLGYHTWRETERDEMMEGMRTRWGVGGGSRNNKPRQTFLLILLFFMPRHWLPPSCGGRGKETRKGGGRTKKGDFKGDDRSGQIEVIRPKSQKNLLSDEWAVYSSTTCGGDDDMMLEDRRKEKVICICISWQLWAELFVCKWKNQQNILCVREWKWEREGARERERWWWKQDKRNNMHSWNWDFNLARHGRGAGWRRKGERIESEGLMRRERAWLKEGGLGCSETRPNMKRMIRVPRQRCEKGRGETEGWEEEEERDGMVT